LGKEIPLENNIMIFIEKQSKDPDISVYKKNLWKRKDGSKTTLAQRDLENSILHYSNPLNFKDNNKLTEKGFTYKAYAHEETKKALKKVFNNKCAYCESYIMHIEPGDIEHFRPKAEIHTIDGAVLKPGYYWLGADWKNLLLSCIKCNRSNNESINIPDTVLTNMGKANHFPLSDETKRLRLHSDRIDDEDAFVLIINPCKENPEDHLIFEDNGQITPKDKKGELSIAVYGLFRADLVLKRNKASIDIERTLITLVKTVQLLETLDARGIPLDDALPILQLQKEKLEFSFHKDAEYLALKRQKLLRFINDNPISHQKLMDNGIDLNSLR